jgi:hypothetical protein
MYTKLTAALLAVFALGAVVCGTAFAEEYTGDVWTKGETIVKENVVVKSKSVGGIKLEDSKMGVAIECLISDEGKIGNEGKGEVTAITTSECKTLKACEAGTITANAVHLPWKTQLQEVEENARDKISNGGSGEPGWKIECKVIGILLTDECNGETSQGTENVSGGVDTIFDSKSAHLNCSAGGPGAGVVSGTDLDESPAGENQITAAPLYRMFANTPGLGFKECTFTGEGQECEVEIQNLSLVPVLVLEIELTGTDATLRYGLLAVGCLFELLLAERRPQQAVGGTCTDRMISFLWVKGWINFYKVQIQALPGTGLLTPEALLQA